MDVPRYNLLDVFVVSGHSSAAEEKKGADIRTADGDPWSSPCVSLERQLTALNSLSLNSLPGKEEEEKVVYTVVDCFQQQFGPAVLHLKQQHVISVIGEGVNLCRHGKLSWLQIATKSRVFLFDIFCLGPPAFRNGLRMVLEDKNILKVMHDCRWISDCLFHQYGVLLVNVFDTQVPFRYCVWEQMFQQEKIQLYLDAQENPDTWFLRPLPASLLQVLALKAMYLLLLHSSLMDNLMSDFTAVVHAYLNTSQNESEDHLGSIKPTCMELPKELRQLADDRKLRREKAVKDYRINEDGLLIRPVIELNERIPQKGETHRDDRDYLPPK
ncbi:hypothetical protein ASZ78_008441 [Callipepla squamata]|uniref:3'-5' exonuclease domain-containing protein n=1 Tax=Callipepla squamata TaxID=9009 RepID=A0A226N0V5_CALSU|nr:hypothetical protein ASZ78_008441 [Callipepla squamata]